MKVETIVKELLEMRSNYAEIKKRISKILEHAAEGHLNVQRNGGSWVYRCNSKNERAYLGSNRREEIKRLEEKYYYENILAAANQNYEVLGRIIKNLKRVEDSDSVFLRIPPQKRHLIQPYVFVKDEAVIRRFENGSVRGRLDKSSNVTLKGENVRSKSELIIADRMKNAGVLYEYEPPTMLDEERLELWHPDFMCLNSRTGETLYWEHFGMIDNSDYRKGFLYKIERYAEAGIFLGEKLIITMESAEHPLSTEYVDLLIKKYLL